MARMKKTVRLDEATYKRLSTYAFKSETFDQAVNRLFEERDDYRRGLGRALKRARKIKGGSS